MFCFRSDLKRLGNVQLIPYPRGLQQNKSREWESNLCPSASTGSQFQLTTSPLPCPTVSLPKYQQNQLTTCDHKAQDGHNFFVYKDRLIKFMFLGSLVPCKGAALNKEKEVVLCVCQRYWLAARRPKCGHRSTTHAATLPMLQAANNAILKDMK